ncbi:MAG TPA: hypothetical protein DEU93_00795 [Chitinophagaceae bacterium]|nr:hypothetical protein [Chitinophagaceae bacterium]HML57031.1 hypothetical protein [Ferruginibacter sp.]
MRGIFLTIIFFSCSGEKILKKDSSQLEKFEIIRSIPKFSNIGAFIGNEIDTVYIYENSSYRWLRIPYTIFDTKGQNVNSDYYNFLHNKSDDFGIVMNLPMEWNINKAKTDSIERELYSWLLDFSKLRTNFSSISYAKKMISEKMQELIYVVNTNNNQTGNLSLKYKKNSNKIKYSLDPQFDSIPNFKLIGINLDIDSENKNSKQSNLNFIYVLNYEFDTITVVEKATFRDLQKKWQKEFESNN